MALAWGRRERGAVAVEMAIILPLLLLVIGGIADFGRMLFTQNIVTNAAREGARMRALGYDAVMAEDRVDDAMLSIVGEMAYDVDAGADCPEAPEPTDLATVSVTVTDFSFIFPIPVTAPDLSAQAQMRCGG